MMLTTTNSLLIATKLLDFGLEINALYLTNREAGHFTTGPSTVLDHVCGMREYLSPKRKKVNDLVESYLVKLTPRRRFVETVIALLHSRGAKRACEILDNN